MIALINGHFADGRRGGIVLRDGLIADFGPHIRAGSVPEAARIIDCDGDLIATGLVDMQAFVGEPGAEYRETLASASRAAMYGGVTSLLTMPNTEPCVDDPAIVDYLRRRAGEKADVRIYPAAALTKGLAGQEISEIGLLQEAGAIAFTDGKKSIERAGIMRRTMTYARDFDALVLHFAQDESLRGDGVMGEGEWASRLGLTGIPWQAETIMLERDLRLVELTGARYHAMAVTNPLSLEVIRRAKQAGLPVTCGVSINHLTLNENDIGGYRTFLKVNPPLPAEDVRKELVAAVASGLIDVIVSDHYPQDVETKRVPFAEAAFGALGLETMLSAGLRLVSSDDLSLQRLFEAMSAAPAKILNLPQGRMSVGAPADIIRVDLDAPYVVDALRLQSRAKNSPFDQARLQGLVKMVLVGGRVIHSV
jgi:dihydroorotase